MFLRATLITLMIAALGLLAFTPSGSATCIDSNPDDNGVGTQGCNVPVVGNCKVLVYGQVGAPSCAQVQCIREPCP